MTRNMSHTPTILHARNPHEAHCLARVIVDECPDAFATYYRNVRGIDVVLTDAPTDTARQCAAWVARILGGAL